MKVLVVDSDAKRRAAVREALAAGGVEVTEAPNGVFALTMLERNRHDVIVSRPRIDDMEGVELCGIVRADPSTRAVRFVLLADAGEVSAEQTAAAGVDLVVPAGTGGATVLPLVLRLMPRGAAAAPAAAAAALTPPTPASPMPVAAPAPLPSSISPAAVPAPSAPAPAAPAAAHPPATPKTPAQGAAAAAVLNLTAQTFQGSLGVMEMEELVQAIAVGGKTGRLLVVLAAGGGMIAFESGRVFHAEFGKASGAAAVEALVAASHREHAGKFCFIPGDGPALASMPRTITTSVDKLLLSIATTLDEKR